MGPEGSTTLAALKRGSTIREVAREKTDLCEGEPDKLL
jgi:hypothetical protein